MLLQTVEIVMADRAPITRRGKYCVSGSREKLVVPILVILRESLHIDFPPTKYCFLVLFDSLVSRSVN